jgi:hypothetical protein
MSHMRGHGGWLLLCLLVLAEVAALDGLEYQFVATRRVHLEHNFPDLLAPLGVPRPRSHLEGTLQAGLSGLVAAALPVGAALLFAVVTTSGPSPRAFELNALATGLLTALTLLAASGAFRDPYLVHKAMYASFGAAFVFSWLAARLHAALPHIW